MTFVRIQSLLIDAFDRIDHRKNIHDQQGEKTVKAILAKYIPIQDGRDVFEYKKGIITIYSPSQVLKQKIQLSKQNIIQQLKKEVSFFSITDIVFKGPK